MEKIKVVVVKPERPAEVKEIEPKLENYQAIVGGLIEPCYPFDDKVAVVVNEEGLFNGSLPNRAWYDEGQIVNIFFGDFFIIGVGEEDFIGLTDEQIARYLEYYKVPEFFIRTDRGIAVIKGDA